MGSRFHRSGKRRPTSAKAPRNSAGIATRCGCRTRSSASLLFDCSQSANALSHRFSNVAAVSRFRDRRCHIAAHGLAATSNRRTSSSRWCSSSRSCCASLASTRSITSISAGRSTLKNSHHRFVDGSSSDVLAVRLGILAGCLPAEVSVSILRVSHVHRVAQWPQRTKPARRAPAPGESLACGSCWLRHLFLVLLQRTEDPFVLQPM